MVLSTGAASAVAKGTRFELRALDVLQKHFSMRLTRVGGASDGGVDLQGWWWLPAPLTSSRLSSAAAVSRSPPSDASLLRFRVLAQCKALHKKVGPSTIREMEGVVYKHNITARASLDVSATLQPPSSSSLPLPTPEEHGRVVAVVLSQSAFTSKAIIAAMSSLSPLMLVHLPDPTRKTAKQSSPGEEVGSVIWNASLAGRDGMLGGEYTVRWTHTQTHAPSKCEENGLYPTSTFVQYPTLLWKGEPLPSISPPAGSD